MSTAPIVRPRMPELDVLRGIAILTVFTFHAFDDIGAPPAAFPLWQRLPLAVVNQGWAGVNLFFVLSGFLITGILLDSRGKPRYYSRFYSHRALRILPAYYLLLLVLFLLGRFFTIAGAGLNDFLGLSAIYLSNVVSLFGVGMFYWPLWSLAVEEHFYLIWPTVVRFLSTRGLTITAAAICMIEPILRLIALHAGTETKWGGPQHSGSFYFTWMYADGLALGALLAIFARSAWGNRSNLWKLAAASAGSSLMALVASLLVSPPLAACLRGTLVNYGALAMVAGSLWLGTGTHSRWMNFRLLSFYGYISYGLYLFHGLVLDSYRQLGRRIVPGLFAGTAFERCCVEFAICLTIATALAYVSRITFEEFFLRMKDKPAKTRATSLFEVSS